LAKKNRNIINNKKYLITTVYLLVIINLLFLYIVKYNNQKLSLFEFHFFNFGNFLDFLFTIITFAGLTVLFIRKDAGWYKRRISIFVFPLVSVIVLITAFILAKAQINFGSSYFMQQPLNKFVIAAVFFLFAILQISYLSYVWMLLMGRSELLIIRSFVNAFVILVGLVGFAFFYSVFNMQGRIKTDQSLEKADVAVVFGSAVWSDNRPSPSLAKRVEKAATLYNLGIVKKIQLTGGNAPGELSEAEVGYKIIAKYHVNMKDVLMEKKTSSTIEQVQFIEQNVVKKEQMRKLILISDVFHLNRIHEICNFHNLDAQLAASDLALSWEKNIYYKLRESVGLIFFWFFAI